MKVDGSGNLTITDTSGVTKNDNLVLKVDGGNFNVRDTGNGINQSVATGSVTGDIVINGGDGDDTFTIDLSGEPIENNIVYHGGVDGFDTLRIIGTGGEVMVYNPDTLNFGNGVIDFGNGHTITFTGLEPVDVIGVASFTLVLPGANDIVDIANGLVETDPINNPGVFEDALILSGTSGGVGFEMARVRNVGTVIINTTSVEGDDAITVTSANNAHGITNLQVITGSGTDSVTVNGAVNLSGTVTLNASAVNLNADIAATSITGNATTVNVASTASIQDGISVAGTGATVNVAAGTYVENVTINKNLTLVSENGRASTTIQGISGVGALGSVVVTPGSTAVTIEGFKIIGIDNGSPGLENAALYFQGAHSGAQIIDNEIVANGDAGLLTEYGLSITNFLIDGNIFSGKTFVGAQPSGIGFGDQFDQPNRPRQLVVIGNGGGDSATASATNITFTNNVINGVAGGISSDNNLSEQGNTLVTIDAANSTITGNTFEGTTTRFGQSLRVRRPDTVISGNTFDSSGLGAATTHLFVQNNTTPVQTIAANNTFDRLVYIDNSTSISHTQVGTASDETFIGSTGSDTITANGGNDIITGRVGDDIIDGGLGTDTAIFSGNYADYVITLEIDSVTITGPDGTDSLTGIEFLQFNDTTVSTAPVVGPHTVAGSGGDDSITIRLYDSSGDFLEVLVNGVVTQLLPTTDLGGITINGTNGNDTLVLDYTNGNPLTGNLTYNGGAGSDRLVVRLAGQNITSTPVNGTDGTLSVGAQTITYTGLEPIDISGGGVVTLVTANANDSMTITEGFDDATGLIPAMIVTSNTASFETHHFFNNTTVVIDTVTSGGDGIDTITISGAANLHGNTNLQIITGDSGATDTVTINGPVTFTGDVLIQTRALSLNALLTAANATFRPQISSTVRIGNGATASNMVLDQTALTTNLALTGTLTVGRADGTGTVTIQDLNTMGEAYDLTIVSGAQVTQAANITNTLTTGANLTILANQLNSGASDFEMATGTSIVANSGSVGITVGTTAGISAMGLRTITASGSVEITSAGTNSITANNAITSTGSFVSITNANAITTNGAISALDDVTLAANGGALAINQGVQTTTGAIDLSASTTVTTALASTISAFETVAITSGTSTTINGNIDANDLVSIDADTNVSVSGGDITVTGAGNIEISANANNSADNDQLTISVGSILTTAGGDIVLTSGDGTQSLSDIVLRGDFITNGGDLLITADDDITFDGVLASGTVLDLDGGALVATAKDNISINGLVSVTSAASELEFNVDADGLTPPNAAAAGAFVMGANGSITGIATLVDINVIDSSGASTVRGIAAGAITLDVTGTGTIASIASTTLNATVGSVTINGPSSVTLGGAVLAATDVDVTVATSLSTTATTGTINAGGTVTLDAGTSVSIGGDIDSGSGVDIEGDTSVTIGADVDIDGGTGTIEITANADGGAAADSLSLDASASFTTVNQDIILKSGLGVNDVSDATIRGTFTTGGGDLLVTVDDDLTFDGSVTAGTTLALGAGRLVASARDSISINGEIDVVSAAELEFNADDDTSPGVGIFSMGGNGSIVGNAGLVDINVLNTSGATTLRTITAGSITVDTTGTSTVTTALTTTLLTGLTASTGNIVINGVSSVATGAPISAALGTVTITSGSTMTLGGTVTAGGKVDLDAGTTFDNNFAITSTGADVDIDAVGAVGNIDGAILAQTNITIDSFSTITVNQSVTATTGTVMINAPGTITTAVAGNLNAATGVQIIGQNAVTLNGNTDAGSGQIIVRANQDGSGAQDLTVRGNLVTTNAAADAIELTVNTIAPNGGSGPQTEIEPNGLVYRASAATLAANAQNVSDPSNWSTVFNADIDDINVAPNLNSTLTPHVSISATGNSTLDVFSFEVTPAMLLSGGGSVRGIFDIDGAWAPGNQFDVELLLFDENGILVNSNDDRGTGPASSDPGSLLNGSRNQDSFINQTFTTAGTYYLVVGEWDTVGADGQVTGNSPDFGDTYTLHISLDHHAATGTGAAVLEIEPNNLPIDFSLNPTLAQNLDGSNWSLANNPKIANSTTIPHTTVLGGGVNGQSSGDSIDVFSFTTTGTPGTVVIDIDDNTFDSEILLYTVNGVLVASSDDATADTGNGFAGASRIETALLDPNTTYYVVVQSKAVSGPGLVGGETYALNISVPGHSVVGGGQGDIIIGNTTDGSAINVETGGGSVTISTVSDGGLDAANVTFDGVTFDTDGGAITVNSNDTITINDGDAVGLSPTNTVRVIGGGALTFNANLDDSGANGFVMTVDGTNGNATILTDSTLPGAVTINVGTTTGTSTVADITTGIGGGVTVIQDGGSLVLDALGVIDAPGAGTVELTNTGSVTVNGGINAGSGLIEITGNSDGIGTEGVTVGVTATLQTSNNTTSAITVTAGNGTPGGEADVSIGAFLIQTGGGNGKLTVNADDNITVNSITSLNVGTSGTGGAEFTALDSLDIAAGATVTVTSASQLIFNANLDGAGADDFDMAATAVITGNASLVGINAGSASGDHNIGDISTGTNGVVTILSTGEGSVTVAAGKSITATGTGAVTINSEGSVTVNGTVDAGNGLIDIDANSAGGLSAQVFAMGTAGKLTTNSTSANSVIITVGSSSGASSVREIDTLGGVLIEVDGDASSLTLSNSTTAPNNGILAGGNVDIDSEGAITVNGTIDAVGTIDIDANSDGDGAAGLTIATTASLISDNTTTSAITLTAGNGAGTEADVTIGAQLIQTGGGNGKLTVNADDNISINSISSLNVGTSGTGGAEFTALDSLNIATGATVSVTSASRLLFNANVDGSTTDDFDMDGTAVINGNATLVQITAGSASGGDHTIGDITTGNNGVVTVTTTGDGSTTVAAGKTVDAPGNGSVTFNTGGTLAVNGTLNAGSGRIDIDANSDGLGTGAFTMGTAGSLITTNNSTSLATPSVAITVGATSGASTVNDITTNGRVIIDANGNGGITVNATGNIVATGTGAVEIDSEGAVTVSGEINAGSGVITIVSDSDISDDGNGIVVNAGAILTTTNATASAITLTAGGASDNNADITLGGVSNATVVTGNGGTVTVNSTDNVTVNDVSVDVGLLGSMIVNAEGTVAFAAGGVITVDRAAELEFNVNTALGADAFTMTATSAIAAGTTGAALVDINIATSSGTSTFSNITTAGNGIVEIDGDGTGILNVIGGTISAPGTGGVTINSEGGIDIDGIVNAGSGLIVIAANSDGLGAQALTGSVTGNLITTNTTASAIDIAVNTAGGTGNGTAAIGNMSVGTAGGIVVTNHQSSISTIAATTATATDGTITLRATDLIVSATSSIDAGTGTVNLVRSTSGQISVNHTVGYQLSEAEIDRITAGTLVIGDSTTTNIEVRGGINTSTATTGAGSGTISGNVELNANNGVLFDNTGATDTFVANGLVVDADLDDNGIGIVDLEPTFSINSSGGDVTINAADFTFQATSSINAGAGDISLLPSSTGRTVELGGTGLGLNVTLSDAELDTLTSSGTLRIGNTSTGDITVSNTVSPAGAPVTVITTADTVFDASGALSDYTGTSLTIDGDLESGATPDFGVFNVTGTFAFANSNTFVVDIQGNATPVAGTHHDQVSTSGAVTIGTNVILDLNQSGTKPPAGTQYRIVNNGSGSAISGLFVDAQTNTILNEGDWIDQGLVLYTISYVGGDGNDVVLTSLGPVETAATVDANGNLLISDIENTATNDTLTFTVVGNNLRINDPNVVVGFDGIPSAVRIDPFTVDVPLAAFNGLIVNTGSGDDVINLNDFSGTSTFTNFLLVDGGTGTDTINFNADYVGSGATDGSLPEAPENRAVEIRADIINVAAGVDIETSSADGTISLVANRNLLMDTGSRIETVDGAISLAANTAGGATGQFNGMRLKTVTLESLTGDISLTAQGGSTSSFNYGVNLETATLSTSGDVDILGTGGGNGGAAAQTGVLINYGTTITAGSIEVVGQGGNSNGTGNAGGIFIGFSSTLTVSTGDLILTGTGGANAGTTNTGVAIGNSTLSSSGGTNILVQGSVNGGGTANEGIEITGGNLSTTGLGTITLQGTGAAGTSSNVGILLGAASQISTVDGDIRIEGTSNGTLAGNHGVNITAGTVVSTTGTGDLIVLGTGGISSNSGSGVALNNSTLQVVNGNLEITGTGRAMNAGRGIETTKGTITSSGTGLIDIAGSGSATATGSNNAGVYIHSTQLNLNDLTGVSTLMINGTGGGGTTLNHGVTLTTSTVLSSLSGDVEITGQARGASGSAAGVSIANSTTVVVAGGGDLTVTGTGSVSGTVSTTQNRGIQVSLSSLSVTDGVLTMNGVGGGGGNGTTNHGIDITGSATTKGVVRATGTGSVVLTGTAGKGGNGINGSYSEILTAVGDIDITGHGGTGTSNTRGIFLTNSTLASSGGGALTLLGDANALTTGTGNVGVWIISTSIGTSGVFSIDGTGGGGTGTNHGIYMQTITNTGGAVTTTGTAGSGATSLAKTGDFLP